MSNPKNTHVHNHSTISLNGGDEKVIQAHVEDVKDNDLERRSVDDFKGASGNHAADNDARNYLNPDIVITEEMNKKLRRRVHKRVLPLMCLVYVVQALDKGSLGPASIMGWRQDVGAQGQDYAMTGTMLWAGLMCGEPFAAQLVRRFPIAKLLSVTMVTWTALSFGLAFSMSIPPVWAIRFLLGFFESTFGPCLLAITVQWYTKEEQPFAAATWQMMLGLASSLTALFGYAFYQIPVGAGSGLRGWQWMMLLIGMISAISTVVTYFFLPDSPTRAKFLTEEEKTLFVERVRRNDQGIRQKEWRSEQAWEAAKDPLAYMLFFLAISQTMVVGGLNTFNALLINEAFGFSVTNAQLLSIPLGVLIVICYQLLAWCIKKTNQTLLVMIGFTIPNVIGTIVLLTVAPSDETKGGLLVAFYAMKVFQACNPAIFLMLARNIAGQSKKSIVYASTYIAWAGGNVIAPQIFQSQWAPRYLNSLYIHLGFYALFITACLVTRVLLIRRNKAKDLAQTDANGVVVNNNSNAFEDLTDIKNPDFRYTI